MNIDSYNKGFADAMQYLSYKPPEEEAPLKFRKPPPLPIYKHVVEAYRVIDNDDIRDKITRNIVSGKCGKYGLKVILEAIAFYDKWMREHPLRIEGHKYKGIKFFFLFKLDEMVKLMTYRKSKEITYRSTDDEGQRLNDPFAK